MTGNPLVLCFSLHKPGREAAWEEEWCERGAETSEKGRGSARIGGRRSRSAGVLTHERQLPGPLLGGDDLQRRRDGLDADDRLVGVVRSGHGQFEVPAHQKFGGHILQL